MSTPLRLLVTVLIASIFLGLFVGLNQNFNQGQSKAQFLQDVEEFTNTVSSLRTQGPGAKLEFSITIPPNCNLSFKGENVIANISGKSIEYNVRVNISGPALEDSGSYNLWIERLDERIEVSVK